jgi:hypothetical protein
MITGFSKLKENAKASVHHVVLLAGLYYRVYLDAKQVKYNQNVDIWPKIL